MVVLVAVCSLTVSVATRYCSPQSVSVSKVASLHKQVSPEGRRQRLTKSAASWLPPVIDAVILKPRSSYRCVVSAVPDVPGALFANTLYNRPPPSL